MAKQLFVNNFKTYLAGDLADDDLTMSILSATGAPVIVAESGDYWLSTLVRQDGSREIVKVTARSSTDCTIERAQEGTTALAFTADPTTVVSARITAEAIQRLETFVSRTKTAVRAYVSGDITWASSSVAKMTFGGESYDENSEFAASTFTAKKADYYDVFSQITVTTTTANQPLSLYIRKNGSPVTSKTLTTRDTELHAVTVMDTIPLAIGDYIEIYASIPVGTVVEGSSESTRSFLTVMGRNFT